jgi:O-antigen/teichoic acid export membrane protein
MNWLAEPAELGIYALAFGLAVHAFAPAQALVGPLIPAISGLREVDEAAVKPAFRRVTRAGSTVVALILSTALAPLALLVPLLYGPEFDAASPVVLALGISAAMATVGGPVFAFVSARLSGRAILAANVVALVVDLGLAVLLIPSLGAWGAVIANAGGAATTLGILGGRELRALGLPLRTALRDALPAVIGSACAVGAFMAGAHVAGPLLLRAVVAGLLGGLACVAVMRVLRVGLSSQDRGAVGRAIPSRVGRLADGVLRWVSVPDRPDA